MAVNLIPALEGLDRGWCAGPVRVDRRGGRPGGSAYPAAVVVEQHDRVARGRSAPTADDTVPSMPFAPRLASTLGPSARTGVGGGDGQRRVGGQPFGEALRHQRFGQDRLGIVRRAPRVEVLPGVVRTDPDLDHVIEPGELSPDRL